jgi:glycosyltransferase involved in cell wall biosynthesis
VKILFVSQYFPPEVCAPANRTYEFSREWTRRGHDVTVLTAFAHHPRGIKAPEDRWRITRRERVEDIDVVRTYVYATANKGIVRRMLSYASFMTSAITIGRWRVSRPDVVVATSPQLLCACAGYVIARSLRAPFVFEVRDLWPESILAVEAMRRNFIINGLRRVARFLYRRSDRIVTAGEGYRRMIHQLYGVDMNRMDVVTNGVDTELFEPGKRDNEIRAEYGWGDRFVVLYMGTHGMAHALHRVLEAAQKLSGNRDILFAFVGEGAEKAQLKKLAAQWELGNVQFIDQQPKSRVPDFYAACDLGLVTLRDTPLFQEVLPSKIFEYMGMEKPLLISVGGEARKTVEAADAGEFVPPENVPALVEAITRLSQQPDKLKQMGLNGRSYVVDHFDRRELAVDYLEILYRVAGLEQSGPGLDEQSPAADQSRPTDEQPIRLRDSK